MHQSDEPHATGGSGLAALTPRERGVLALVATGLSDHAVAVRLAIADATVRKHLEHVYRKLQVGNRVSATVIWLTATTDRGAPADAGNRVFTTL